MAVIRSVSKKLDCRIDAKCCVQSSTVPSVIQSETYYQLPISLILAFKVIALRNCVNQFSLNLFS